MYGRRPWWSRAPRPEEAKELAQEYIEAPKEQFKAVGKHLEELE